jgi:hypothetical protein
MDVLTEIGGTLLEHPPYSPDLYIQKGVITNDVSDYINLLVRIAHIICNHALYYRLQTLRYSEALRFKLTSLTQSA